MKHKHVVTWDMIQIYTKKLAYKLSKIKKWNNIIAVSRGGLVPATLLARELSIHYVDTVCISSYNHNTLKNIKVIKKPKKYSNKTIIVDDLVDTGGTAEMIRKFFPNSYFVTIFAKPKSRHLVDKYIIDIPQKVWIEQPWDMEIIYNSPIVQEPDIT